MRDPKRIDKVINELKKFWKSAPDLRLCQLLSSAARSADWINNDLFYLEDDRLLEGLTKLSQQSTYYPGVKNDKRTDRKRKQKN
jgi:uncharacterized protein YihD (DUF1040 family)